MGLSWCKRLWRNGVYCRSCIFRTLWKRPSQLGTTRLLDS